MALFVTATGSDVGKTVVCALLAHRFAAAQKQAAKPLRYWKPIATGILRPTRGHARRDAGASLSGAPPTDSEVFAALSAGNGHVLPETYSFTADVAPHWAARQARQPITLARLTEALDTHRANRTPLLVEGIGGVLVPLNDKGQNMADWLMATKMACVVVAHTGLGTLNHTLLTLEALRHRQVRVAGVVLNGPAHPDNRRSLAAFGGVPIIDSVPWMTPLNAESVSRQARMFDAEGVLAPFWSMP